MKSIIVFFLFSLLYNLSAQTTKTYSLSDCIDLVLQNSFRVKAEQQRINSAEAEFKKEKTSYLPQLFADFSHDQLFYNQYDYRQQLSSLRLDWQFGDLLTQSARSGKMLVLVQRARRRNAQLKIVGQTVDLYIASLDNQMQIDLLNSRKDLLEKHLDISKALWQSGVRTRLDVLQTESEIMQIDEQILAAQLEWNNRRQELARLMGLENYQSLKLSEIEDNSIGSGFPETSNLKKFVTNHPIIKALQQEANATRLETARVKAALYPQIEINGGYFVDRDPTAEGNYWIGSIGLQIPLFQWNKSSYDMQKINANANVIDAEKQQIHRELFIRVSNSIERIKQLSNLLSIQKNRLEKSREAFQIASSNYKAGLITNLEYLAAQQKLIENRMQLAQTRLNHVQSVFQYYLLTNQPKKISGRALD